MRDLSLKHWAKCGHDCERCDKRRLLHFQQQQQQNQQQRRHTKQQWHTKLSKFATIANNAISQEYTSRQTQRSVTNIGCWALGSDTTTFHIYMVLYICRVAEAERIRSGTWLCWHSTVKISWRTRLLNIILQYCWKGRINIANVATSCATLLWWRIAY